MDINFFIFRLKHLKGIGNKGLLRILYYYLSNPENEFNSQTFIEVGKVKPLYLDSFKHSYELAEGIKREDFENFQEYYNIYLKEKILNKFVFKNNIELKNELLLSALSNFLIFSNEIKIETITSLIEEPEKKDLIKNQIGMTKK